MTIIKLVVLVAFLSIGGCGCGDSRGNGCNFDFDSFLNGNNAQQATSEWACESSVGELFVFRAFRDGTGFSTGLGVFTFQQSGCRSANFQSGEGNGEIFGIDGSIVSGVLTFTQMFNNTGEQFNVGCVLIIF